MTINEKFKQGLEEQFHFGFEVKGHGFPFDSLTICPKDSEQMLFQVEVEIVNQIRINIVAKPEKYGRNFLRAINEFNENKRKNFVEYWKSFNGKKITVKVNEVPVEPEYFLNDRTNWNSFSIRYTESPFYDEEDKRENRDEEIIKKVGVIIAMILSLADYTILGYQEGEKSEKTITKYERNPINRKICLAIKGYKCSVCGFDFEQTYGEIGHEYIEVHHAVMVSEMEKGHVVDISKELFPICPNCHAMIHRRNPPFSIEELKEILSKNKKMDQ